MDVNAQEQVVERPADYPRGPVVIPHRNNAAEWIMAAVVFPAAWVARLALRLIGRGDRILRVEREGK